MHTMFIVRILIDGSLLMVGTHQLMHALNAQQEPIAAVLVRLFSVLHVLGVRRARIAAVLALRSAVYV